MSSPPSAPAEHDLPTVLAVGVVAYVLAKLVHEGLGHGLACVLAGGDLVGFSSSWCDCEKAGLSAWAVRAGKAAGTVANLAVGAACLAASRGVARPATRFFAWLSAAVHLLMGGGYLLVDPIFGFGDWDAFVEGLPRPLAWRAGLVAAGLAITLAAFFALVRGLGAFARDRRTARLLCWPPYFVAGGAILTGAALLNRLGPIYAFTSALATLGGTFPIVFVPEALRAADVDPVVVRRDRAWIAAGIATAVFLFSLFGPGIGGYDRSP